jgi:hypothetical protein
MRIRDVEGIGCYALQFVCGSCSRLAEQSALATNSADYTITSSVPTAADVDASPDVISCKQKIRLSCAQLVCVQTPSLRKLMYQFGRLMA